MAITANFIPTIWSARLIQSLTPRTVYAALLNRNYEGEIRGGGDTVKIPTVTTSITVGDYSVNTDIAAPQILSDSAQDLVIDQQKYFNFYVDDVDRYQAAPNLMDEAMRLAGVSIAQTVDTFAATLLGDARTVATQLVDGSGTAFASVTDGYFPELRELARLMKRKNIDPATRKWLVVPPEFVENVEKKVLSDGISGNIYAPASVEETLRNGFRGRLLGFDMFESNRVPTEGSGATEKYRCFAGTMDVGTFAEQIAEIEPYRPEARFGDAVKGLYVYGAKVTDADQLFELLIDSEKTS